MTDDLLFSPGTEYVEIKCWDCGHAVIRRPHELPLGITAHQFEKRAICQCGTGWPQTTRYPRKKPTSM